MPESRSVLERLLQAGDAPSLDAAWQEFLSEYGRLLLHVSWAGTHSYDAAMDRYACILEQLRADDFRRLRSYGSTGRGKFTTWLVVVARRICVDAERRRYGRPRGAVAEHGVRRRLVDLVGAEVELETLTDDAAPLPGDELYASEVGEALSRAIDGLSAADRLLLRLRFEDEVPVAEIARVLSLPSVFHVYRRLNGILKQLRGSLREQGVEDPRL